MPNSTTRNYHPGEFKLICSLLGSQHESDIQHSLRNAKKHLKKAINLDVNVFNEYDGQIIAPMNPLPQETLLTFAYQFSARAANLILDCTNIDIFAKNSAGKTIFSLIIDNTPVKSSFPLDFCENLMLRVREKEIPEYIIMVVEAKIAELSSKIKLCLFERALKKFCERIILHNKNLHIAGEPSMIRFNSSSSSSSGASAAFSLTNFTSFDLRKRICGLQLATTDASNKFARIQEVAATSASACDILDVHQLLQELKPSCLPNNYVRGPLLSGSANNHYFKGCVALDEELNTLQRSIDEIDNVKIMLKYLSEASYWHNILKTLNIRVEDNVQFFAKTTIANNVLNKDSNGHYVMSAANAKYSLPNPILVNISGSTLSLEDIVNNYKNMLDKIVNVKKYHITRHALDLDKEIAKFEDKLQDLILLCTRADKLKIITKFIVAAKINISLIDNNITIISKMFIAYRNLNEMTLRLSNCLGMDGLISLLKLHADKLSDTFVFSLQKYHLNCSQIYFLLNNGRYDVDSGELLNNLNAAFNVNILNQYSVGYSPRANIPVDKQELKTFVNTKNDLIVLEYCLGVANVIMSEFITVFNKMNEQSNYIVKLIGFELSSNMPVEYNEFLTENFWISCSRLAYLMKLLKDVAFKEITQQPAAANNFKM